MGCWVRSFPLPQRKSLAAQYLSQPQQMRSGWAGCMGIRRAIFGQGLCGAVVTTDLIGRYPLTGRPLPSSKGIYGWPLTIALSI